MKLFDNREIWKAEVLFLCPAYGRHGRWLNVKRTLCGINWQFVLNQSSRSAKKYKYHSQKWQGEIFNCWSVDFDVNQCLLKDNNTQKWKSLRHVFITRVFLTNLTPLTTKYSVTLHTTRLKEIVFKHLSKSTYSWLIFSDKQVGFRPKQNLECLLWQCKQIKQTYSNRRWRTIEKWNAKWHQCSKYQQEPFCRFIFQSRVGPSF